MKKTNVLLLIVSLIFVSFLSLLLLEPLYLLYGNQKAFDSRKEQKTLNSFSVFFERSGLDSFIKDE